MHHTQKMFIFVVFVVFIFNLSIFASDDGNPAAVQTPEPKTQDKLKLNFAFGLSLLQGNTESLLVNSDLNLNWTLFVEKIKQNTSTKPGVANNDRSSSDSVVQPQNITPEIYRTKSEIRFSNQFYYLVIGDEQKANKSDTQLTFFYHFPKLFSFFVYTRPSYNQLQDLDYRIENAIGGKINFLHDLGSSESKDELSLSAGVVYEIFKYNNDEQMQATRLSIRPKLEWDLSDNVNFSFQLFWQPNVEDFNDYRMLLRSALEFRISSSISFVFKLDGEYNSIVPEGVKQRDFILTNNMKITL
jgi:putative salt-induced outer membrane protein YdiY